MAYLLLSAIFLVLLIVVVVIINQSWKKQLTTFEKKISDTTSQEDVYFIETENDRWKTVADGFNTLVRKLKSLQDKLSDYKDLGSEKKTVESQLTASQSVMSRMQMLTEIGNKITSNLSRGDIARNVSEVITSMMDASVIYIAVYNKKEGTMEYIKQGKGGSVADEVVLWCYRNTKEVLLNDAEKDYERYLATPVSVEGKKLASVLCLPLWVNNKCNGVLFLGSMHKGIFTGEQTGLIKLLIPYISIAVDNATVYEELQKMQEELIHTEKMVYLGQMSSGVAHEIKNPLNFITNFAEISKELATEIEEELAKSDHSTELKKRIEELKETNLKIQEHGNRADAIVTQMLAYGDMQASHKSQTELYALIRSTCKDLAEKNIIIELAFDGDSALLMLNEGEILKALKMLLANAEYALHEKARKQKDFIPQINISTIRHNNKIELKIKDNGTGISQENIEKIFVPFFTTKPTGDGVGMGLSICYSIIVNSHNGDIKIESEEGKWTEVVVVI